MEFIKPCSPVDVFYSVNLDQSDAVYLWKFSSDIQLFVYIFQNKNGVV